MAQTAPESTVPDSGENRPTDPDMHWTGWALERLREVVDLDIRTKRLTLQDQSQILRGATWPDYDLRQSRLSRSVRLSIAMSERIRTDYLMRKAERKGSGEQERRRQRREQAADTVVKAVAKPDEAGDVERVRSLVWEALVEDEILDVQIDTLSPEDFLREVCRKIGRPPPSIPLPQGCDDAAGAPMIDAAATHSGRVPVESWSRPLDDSAIAQIMPAPSKPDSS